MAEGLFTWPADQPQLIGSSCRACGTITFPAQDSCPCCTGRETEQRLLGRQGRLWTFTVQAFCPKTPPYSGPDRDGTFTPFGVGYVELPGEVKVESRLTGAAPGEFCIGMEMELVVVPFGHTPTGDEIVTFAFAPSY